MFSVALIREGIRCVREITAVCGGDYLYAAVCGVLGLTGDRGNKKEMKYVMIIELKSTVNEKYEIEFVELDGCWIC